MKTEQKETNMRSSGILLPIFSLPSKYGIGCISKEAYEFIDFLKASGQTHWQILPIGQTSYGDSPYQSFSTFACNPYFIDLDEFIQEGIISKRDCEAYDWGNHEEYIDYKTLYKNRFALLKTVYKRSSISKDKNFLKYQEKNSAWLQDYALFMALKDACGGCSWQQWDKPLKSRDPVTLENYKKELIYEIEFYMFLQFKFAKQWSKLKKYANKNGIKIIGDIPIYVAEDSADTWTHPELFQFEDDLTPKAVAGCPPDDFCATGQLWGNPLYAWDVHETSNFSWWKERIEQCAKLYDIVRIDHFRGFDEYYSIPAGDSTAEFGTWESGPGMKLFDALSESTQELDIIAEDLGFMTPSVIQLVKDSTYPNMKVLQFGFTPYGDSEYLPHNYDKNCVVYTGTHDNETTIGWYRNQTMKTKKFILEYNNIPLLKVTGKKAEQAMVQSMIRQAMMSPANTCIIPIQDYLGLDNAARINAPSTLGDNWKWRMKKDVLTKKKAKQIRQLTKLSSRLNKTN